jgi:hypothetical protein
MFPLLRELGRLVHLTPQKGFGQEKASLLIERKLNAKRSLMGKVVEL